MYEKIHHPLLPKHLFIFRLLGNFLIILSFVAISLFFGVLGYHHFEKMTWLDACQGSLNPSFIFKIIC